MKTKGFTLIETLVAVSILTIAMSAAFFSANSSLVAARIARDQLIASSLAQGGIEYVRLARDNYYLARYRGLDGTMSEDAWNDFLTWANQSYLAPAAPPACKSSACAPFTRTLQISTISASGAPLLNEVRVISTASWMDHGVSHTVSITDHLTLWQ